jgi:phosphate transport system permease protein
MVRLVEDAMYVVPQSLRGRVRPGPSRLQVALRAVVPAAFSGIAASFLLPFRGHRRNDDVAIAAGQQPRLTLNPLVPVDDDGLHSPGQSRRYPQDDRV